MSRLKKLDAPGTIALLILLFFILDRALSAHFLLPDFCNEDERWVRDGAIKMVRTAALDPGTHKYPELMTMLTAGLYAALPRALPFVSTIVAGRMLAAA